jgi:hypothetical protein
MVARSLAFACCLTMIVALRVPAQDPNAQAMPNPQEMQMQVQRIMQERPREAEAAARAFLHLLSTQPGQGPVEPQLAMLDSLKTADANVYWSEVAQLTVQFNMVQNVVRRDSVRAGFVIGMFALESRARAIQRSYRNASEAQRTLLRSQLETLISHHFDLENELRQLEIKDIERRLADVRAETQRRIDRRAEFVKFAVDDIIRDAVRPR